MGLSIKFKNILDVGTTLLLRKLGFQKFDDFRRLISVEGDPNDSIANMDLWLIPASKYDEIPKGYMVTDIFGNTEAFEGRKTCCKSDVGPDGLLPIGVLRPAEDSKATEALRSIQFVTCKTVMLDGKVVEAGTECYDRRLLKYAVEAYTVIDHNLIDDGRGSFTVVLLVEPGTGALIRDALNNELCNVNNIGQADCNANSANKYGDTVFFSISTNDKRSANDIESRAYEIANSVKLDKSASDAGGQASKLSNKTIKKSIRMRIVRYNNEQVQQELRAKTKPEPWLHVCITDAYPNGESMYAIYVWDTRQIVETGKCKPSACDDATRALDNHKPLVGEYADLFDFSKRASVAKRDEALIRDLNTTIANCHAVSRHGIDFPMVNRTIESLKRKLTALKRRKPSGDTEQDKLLEEAKRELDNAIQYLQHVKQRHSL